MNMLQVRIIFYLCFPALFSSFVQSKLDEECPEPEENYPCYCEDEEMEGGPVVHCNHLTSAKQVKDGLSKLSKYSILKVSFTKNEIDLLDPQTFEGLTIKRIEFFQSTAKIPSPQFRGLEKSLAYLTFLKCFNKDNLVTSLSLGHLENLRDLAIEENDIEVLKDNWLTSAPLSLKRISLDDNGIQKLEDRVFAEAKGLTTLFLMNNKLKVLKRSMFPKPAENLRYMGLSDNYILSFPNDMFSEMPSLTSLELKNNALYALDEKVWSPIIGDITRLYLEGNPIICDRSLKWIVGKTLPSIFTGRCYGPRILKGKQIRRLTAYDLS